MLIEKTMVRKPAFDVIVSVYALKSFVFGNRIPKSNSNIGVLNRFRFQL